MLEHFIEYFKISLIFILGSIVLILLDSLFAFTFLKEQSVRFLSPIVFFTQNISLEVDTFLKSFQNTKAIYYENLHLKEENNRLIGEELQNQVLEKENEILRKQVNIQEGQDYNKLLADIVGMEQGVSLGSIFINKGKKQHLQEGMPVIIDNRLVGMVDEVFLSRSKVKLVNSGNILQIELSQPIKLTCYVFVQ